MANAVRANFIHCENIDMCLKQLQHDEYLAVAVSRLHVKNNPVISRTELFCFSRQNNVYSYSVAMPLKNYYELVDRIDLVISSLMEFGLIAKWVKSDDAPSTRTLIARAQAKHYQTEYGNVVLTIEHIVGALIIMAFGYILAIIAFLIEQIVHRKVRDGTNSKLYVYLHKVFGPKRTVTQTIVKKM